MGHESSPKASGRPSTYNELVAEYRAAVKRCEAQLDDLAAAERHLREYAATRYGGATPYDFGAIDALRSELVKHSRLDPPASPPAISDREREVFELIGMGLTTQEIARRLSLAISTVETYRERLKQKLNLPTCNALMREAVLWAANKDPQRLELRSGPQ